MPMLPNSTLSRNLLASASGHLRSCRPSWTSSERSSNSINSMCRWTAMVRAAMVRAAMRARVSAEIPRPSASFPIDRNNGNPLWNARRNQPPARHSWRRPGNVANGGTVPKYFPVRQLIDHTCKDPIELANCLVRPAAGSIRTSRRFRTFGSCKSGGCLVLLSSRVRAPAPCRNAVHPPRRPDRPRSASGCCPATLRAGVSRPSERAAGIEAPRHQALRQIPLEPAVRGMFQLVHRVVTPCVWAERPVVPYVSDAESTGSHVRH